MAHLRILPPLRWGMQGITHTVRAPDAGRPGCAKATLPNRRNEPDLAAAALPGEEAVLRAVQRAVRGETGGLRPLLPYLGPAFVTAVAHVDPGKLRYRYREGRAVRLPTPLGRFGRQCHGAARPKHKCGARHRNARKSR